MQAVMENTMVKGEGKERARRFLEQVVYLDRRVEAMLDRAERSRARLTRLTAVYGERGGKGARADWTDMLAAVMEDDERLNAEIDRLVDVKERVKREIGLIGDAEMQALLEFRYLNGYTWQQIAMRLHVDRRTVSRLHAKALERIRVPEGF